MIRLSAILETFETELLSQFGHTLLPSQRQALAAMKRCRTAHSPCFEVHCSDCDHTQYLPHSCGHRSCPHCQHHQGQQWLDAQRQKHVPAEYFLLTFTLPAELRDLAWHQPRSVYDAMLRCSWQTVRQFTENDPQLQGQPGAIAVLHTHSRRLDYHPHVHLVMPAAAVDVEHRLWRTKGGKKAKRKNAAGFLFPQRALATVFRAKLLDALHREELPLPPHYPQQWVVHCQSVGSGEQALVYLGRYLYKGVLQEKDILACNNGQVTFRYQDGKTRQWQTRTLPGVAFLRLLLQHVLPKGLRRARNFGFLHPNSKRLIALLQWLLERRTLQPDRSPSPRPAPRCPNCGAKMLIVRTRVPLPLALASTGASG